MSVALHGLDDLPGWLAPVAEVLRTDPLPSLTRWAPPTDSHPRQAAVLVLFGHTDDGPVVLLLERAHDMRSHAGQVAFPGGASDPGDADEAATALREAVEETGLDLEGVEVLGTLPQLWLPPSNFAVTPVVARWRTPSRVYAVDAAETASVHIVPIAELADPAHRVTVRHPSGFLGPAFLVRDLVVWGFTAGMLASLLDLVGWSRPWDDSHVVDLPEPLVASSMRDLGRANANRPDIGRAILDGAGIGQADPGRAEPGAGDRERAELEP